MVQYRIDLIGDTSGHVKWQFQADHDTDENYDADRLELINIINKLTEFNRQLLSNEA